MATTDETGALLARCRSLVEDDSLLSHQFFDVIQRRSDRGRAALLRWSQEDYWVARSFPALLGFLIANTFDVEVRHILVQNLWEESGRGHLEAAHFSLYRSFLKSIGVETPPEGVRSDEFIDSQVRLAMRDAVVGVAAFCYASEYLCLFEFEPITKAVEHYFPNADKRYLKEIKVDVRHTAQLEEALGLLLGPAYDGSRDRDIEEAIGETLLARRHLYDRVMAQV